MQTAIIVALCIGAVLAPPPEDEQQQELHWAVRLGMRVHQVDRAFPVVDRVVLVPDVATYVDEIAKWSPAGRWPVLIEDEQYAPMLIRRFQPREVLRRESVGSPPGSKQEREAMLASIPIRTFGGDPERQSLQQVFASHQYKPPGVVVASVEDPAWTAGVALAAGRGQPLLWLDDHAGSPNSTMNQEQGRKLATQIESLIAEQGYSYARLGDAIDTITLCRSIPGRINLPRADNGTNEPAAMTDFLGRHADGSRYAIASWIFGDEIRSAYVAMCSIFLPRDSVRLYNTYPKEGAFANYTVNAAGGLLSQRGFEVTTYSGDAAGESAWLDMIRSGISVDVFLVNTKGNVDFFDLADARVTANDVPILNHPAVVHFTHSWSMRQPEDVNTIAGRFIEGGAYAYVGSVHEPMLAAFIPPLALAERWSKFVPVLVAARHWEDPPAFGGPWKVNLYGDPLMVALSPTHNAAERVEIDADSGVDVRKLAQERMREITNDASSAALADSIVMLELLGRDEIAVQLWRAAVDRGVSEQVAQLSLGPLFRNGEAREFLRAFREAGRSDPLAVTMLWHKLTPELAGIDEHDVFLELQSALRRPLVHGDIARLAPHLSRAFGPAHVRSLIDGEIEQTSSNRALRELRQSRRRY